MVVVATLFLISLFFVPLFTVVPPHAYGAALIAIGISMIAPIAKIDFSDDTELLPAVLTIILTSFTYNIGIGITAGLLTYPVFKLFAGRGKEVPSSMWLLAVLSLTFYLVYPYRH